ncbi:hypothetical protein P7K49_025147 [Saguinus oedipus]|uniref:G-protein coupled receptors family 2 profile 1 domain-containing protein n=1 Tax=Saguinus oedipus TaxID=9490 RepID=A0ABQ9UHP8_SAGOE|nr:hypothetical protein P7K49_025147 [Saguinus oedipus]
MPSVTPGPRSAVRRSPLDTEGAGDGAPPRGAARPRPLAPPLAVVERLYPQLLSGKAALEIGAGPAGARTPRSLGRSLSRPLPHSHAGHALPLLLYTRLRGAMDPALLHSLLEANCSLALAEELLLDGWGPPLDPEGRREESGFFPLALVVPQTPRSECPKAPRAPGGPSEPCSALSRCQIGTCWPRSAAGALVERPCPEYFNGVKYNTTRECPRPSLPALHPRFRE